MPIWVFAVVLLVIALAVGVTATLGLFSGSAANPGNLVAAGSMSQSNSANNAAIMNAANLVPGEDAEGSVTIQNVGDARATFTLTTEDVTDEPGTGDGVLSERLVVRVVDTGSDESVYTGPLSEVAVDLGTWEPDEERSYLITVTLPDGADGTDDDYQGSAATAAFVWSAVQAQ